MADRTVYELDNKRNEVLKTGASIAEQAFVRYRTDVYRFLLRRTRNHCDAEELTQQVFADATAALSRSEPPHSMRGWLYAVAERRLIDELRRRKRAATFADAATADLGATGEDTMQALEDAVDRLPDLQRRVVVMRIVEGRTYGEIAQALDCNEATCKMRLSRALRRLRDELDAAS
jgi:RNA polymerase sigma-70 factor (ECF subfamily)